MEEYTEEYIFSFENRSKGQFLHQKINMIVNFEAVQIVGVTLQSHEKTSKGNVGSQPGAFSRRGIVSFNSINLSIHNIFELVGSVTTMMNILII